MHIVSSQANKTYDLSNTLKKYRTQSDISSHFTSPIEGTLMAQVLSALKREAMIIMIYKQSFHNQPASRKFPKGKEPKVL